jgi:uncharacterized protein (TIGR00369 family)
MCFVCGKDNPHGIGAQWYLRDDGTLYTEIKLTEHQQGPPGYAHGGASAALLDEAMGLCVWGAGYQVVAANLNVDFLKPVPLGVELKITARVNGQEGRVVQTTGEIVLPDGEVAVEGKGIFVENSKWFKKLGGFGEVEEQAERNSSKHP